MSTKQKTSLSEWSECIRCKKIINCRHVGKHATECESLTAQDNLTYGYIHRGVMHGLVASVSEGELQVDKVVSRLPNSIKRNLLYIHPSCLPLCNLSIGQPCVVDGEYVQTVWPCPLTNPSMVGLSSEIQGKLQKKSKDFVMISPLNQPQLQAAVLHIKSQILTFSVVKKIFTQMWNFQSFYKRKLMENILPKIIFTPFIILAKFVLSLFLRYKASQIK